MQWTNWRLTLMPTGEVAVKSFKDPKAFHPPSGKCMSTVLIVMPAVVEMTRNVPVVVALPLEPNAMVMAVTTYLSTNADTSHDTACRVAIHILGGITRVSSICSEVVSLAWEEAPAEISEASRMQNAFSHTLKVLFLV